MKEGLMNRNQHARLREIVAQTLGVDPEEIDSDSSPKTIPQWDSYNHLRLVAAVEESFGVLFAMEEMTSIWSFADIERFLGKNLTHEGKRDIRQ